MEFKSEEIFKALNLINNINRTELKDLVIDGKRLKGDNLDSWEFQRATYYKEKNSERYLDMLKYME